MQNLRLIKNRIKSAKNIAQITKAMELVAASKMKKAQAAADAGKLYAEMIREMVMKLGSKVDVSTHPLLLKPKQETGKRLIVLISTNKGLNGSLNSNLFRRLIQQYGDIKHHEIVTLGVKGAAFVSPLGGNIVADFSQSGRFTAIVEPVTEFVKEKFIAGEIDGVDIVYNQFVSVLKQEPRVKTILPLSVENIGVTEEEQKKELPFLVEPSPEEVFDRLLPEYVENQMRDAVLQAEASEYAAQMVAMRNATDNAHTFIEELTLVYNKVRQEKITNEIADLVTARAAIVSE
jgi:F-type H+-transporting ATPase subunit gamma